VLRHVAGGVEDGVPGSALEDREPAVPIAVQLLDLGEALGMRLATVERRDLVPAGQRRLDQREADEPRPPDQQKPQVTLQR
jgi:hypothetical protein